MVYTLFLIYLSPASMNTSQPLSIAKNFALALQPHTYSCHPSSQKMAAFYTFVNHSLNICSNPTLFNIEIQYLKAISLDRGYNLQ